MSSELDSQIIKLYSEGYTRDEISFILNVDIRYVNRILSNLSYQDRVKHIDALVNRKYELYRSIFDDEEAKAKATLFKKALMSKLRGSVDA